MAKQAKEAMSAAAKKQKALLDMLDSMGNLSGRGSQQATAADTARAAARVSGAKAFGGGSSSQRRKSIRQQNVDLRKTLEKLRRKLENPATQQAAASAAVPAAASPAASAGAEATAGAVGAAGKKPGLSLEAIFGKGKSALKTPLGKTAGVVGVAMLIDALVKGGLGLAGQIDQTLLQGQALDAQAAAMNPEATTERMMQPITKAQRDQAMMLLMRQLGVKGSSVADGEAWT
jgi:hypothetical protein